MIHSYLFVFQDHHLGTVSLTNMESYTLKPQLFVGISTSFRSGVFTLSELTPKNIPQVVTFLSPLGKFTPRFFFPRPFINESKVMSHQLPSPSKVGLQEEPHFGGENFSPNVFFFRSVKLQKFFFGEKKRRLNEEYICSQKKKHLFVWWHKVPCCKGVVVVCVCVFFWVCFWVWDRNRKVG